MDNLQSTFSIVNSSGANLLNSIINKSYMQVVILQKELHKKNDLVLLTNATSRATIIWQKNGQLDIAKFDF